MASDRADRFLADVRSVVRDHVSGKAAAWSHGEAPDLATRQRAAEVGLTRIEVPAEFGGLGLGFRAKAEACAVVAAADFGLAMSLVNTHNVAKRIASTAPAAVAQRLLPDLIAGRVSACTALTEPGAGSDAAAMRCAARKTDGGWLLDGEKSWIVNGRHAGMAIVYAQGGSPGQGSGIAAFLVDLNGPGCARYPLESGFSQTSIGTGGFRLTECFVPDSHLLLPAGTAFKAILEEINGARTYVAAMCCAMVSAALRQAHPTWREPLAEAATRLAAAWVLVEAAIRAFEQGGETRHLAAAAKVNAVALAQAELPRLLHAMGAEGLRETYPFTRHIGAAHIAALTDGSTAMLLDRLGRWDPTPIEL